MLNRIRRESTVNFQLTTTVAFVYHNMCRVHIHPYWLQSLGADRVGVLSRIQLQSKLTQFGSNSAGINTHVKLTRIYIRIASDLMIIELSGSVYMCVAYPNAPIV